MPAIEELENLPLADGRKPLAAKEQNRPRLRMSWSPLFFPLFGRKPSDALLVDEPVESSQSSTTAKPRKPVVLSDLPNEIVGGILEMALSCDGEPDAFARQARRLRLLRVCKLWREMLADVDVGVYAISLALSKKKTSRLYSKCCQSKKLCRKIKELSIEMRVGSSGLSRDVAGDKLLNLYPRLPALNKLHIIAQGHRHRPIITIVFGDGYLELQVYPRGDVDVEDEKLLRNVDLATEVTAALFSNFPEFSVFDCSVPLLLHMLSGQPGTVRVDGLGQRPGWCYHNDHSYCHSMEVELIGRGMSSHNEQINLATFIVSKQLKVAGISVGGGCVHHGGEHPVIEQEALPGLERLTTSDLIIHDTMLAAEWFGRFTGLRYLRIDEVVAPDATSHLAALAEIIPSLPASMDLELGEPEDADDADLLVEVCREHDVRLKWI